LNTETVADIIKNNDNFLIITHVGPDGDAIGSTLGLFNALLENGKKADAYFHEEIPSGYLPLIPENLKPYLHGDLPQFSKYDMILCLDFSSPERFGKVDLSKYNSVNIDHHPDNTKFAEQNFVFPEAAATAVIIFDILKNLSPDLRISQNTATLLLTGLITDTGGFRFQNTSPAALRSGAELLEAGADYSEIINTIFFSKSANLAKMEAEIICYHMKTACGGRFAWFFLSDELLDSFDIIEKDTEGLIDLIRSIKEFDIVAILKEKDNGFRISLRSKQKQYSVGSVARKLNGGGHDLAAGGFIPAETLEEAEDILIQEISNLIL
jgi:phosphoesterase RecJ-like protein